MLVVDDVRWALLAGLLRGDGDVDYQNRERAYVKRGRRYVHHLNTCSVGYFSSSPVLFQQVTALLQGFNLVPTFKGRRPHLRLMLIGTVGVLQSLLAKRTIQCACLGAVFNLPMSWVTLVEDLLMAGMAAGMLVIDMWIVNAV